MPNPYRCWCEWLKERNRMDEPNRPELCLLSEQIVEDAKHHVYLECEAKYKGYVKLPTEQGLVEWLREHHMYAKGYAMSVQDAEDLARALITAWGRDNE